jgi:hypothetical protein
MKLGWVEDFLEFPADYSTLIPSKEQPTNFPRSIFKEENEIKINK